MQCYLSACAEGKGATALSRPEQNPNRVTRHPRPSEALEQVQSHSQEDVHKNPCFPQSFFLLLFFVNRPKDVRSDSPVVMVFLPRGQRTMSAQLYGKNAACRALHWKSRSTVPGGGSIS